MLQRSISVIDAHTARTFLSTGGEQPGVVENAIWLGHLPEIHYFAVLRDNPEQGLVRSDCLLCTKQFTCAAHTKRVSAKPAAKAHSASRKRIVGKQKSPAGYASIPTRSEAMADACKPWRGGKARQQVKQCWRCKGWGHRQDSKK
eukprot:8090502-Karenia_brevis.AAC.1